MPGTAASFMEDYERREKRLRIACLNTRIDLRRSLASLGVTSVTATYEGCADSGNVTALAARGSDAVRKSDLGKDLEERLMDFCWDVAYGEHPGFEIDAGANGEIRWDLPEDKMELDHYSRVEEREHFPACDLCGETSTHQDAGERFDRLVTGRAELVKDLRSIGVTAVTATYDAYGDSGNVEQITVTPDGVELDDGLEERLADFCWDVAYAAHPGFEIDAGGNGEVRWNIEENRIDLDHYSNFEDFDLVQNDDVGRSLMDDVRSNPDLYPVHPVTGEIAFADNDAPRDKRPEPEEDARDTPGPS